MQLECLYNENNLLKVKMNLRIRFANEQLTDLQLPPIDPRRTSVVQVKHMIWQNRPTLGRSNRLPEDLKLICQGRLLVDSQLLVDALPASALSVSRDDQLPAGRGINESTPLISPDVSSESPSITLHCLEPIIPRNSNEHSVPLQQQQQSQPHPIAPLFGFDRLRFAGFSAEDIEEIRQQFHRWRRPTTRDIEATQNQNRRQRHLLEAEEQWLEHAQLNQSPVMDLEGGAASDDDNNNYEDGDDFNASNRNTIRNDNDEITNIENNNSSSRNNSRAQYEVLLGVVMGFFMTWQILMLMGEKHLFSSYRIQIGIAFGILFNLTFTLLHQIVHG